MRPGKESPGNAETRNATSWPSLRFARCRSGIRKATSREPVSKIRTTRSLFSMKSPSETWRAPVLPVTGATMRVSFSWRRMSRRSRPTRGSAGAFLAFLYVSSVIPPSALRSLPQYLEM